MPDMMTEFPKKCTVSLKCQAFHHSRGPTTGRDTYHQRKADNEKEHNQVNWIARLNRISKIYLNWGG